MRRATSVLPQPVGPIMRTFRGVTSLRREGGSCRRRHRLRIAMATARFAADWPTMWRLSSATTSVGRRLMAEIHPGCSAASAPLGGAAGAAAAGGGASPVASADESSTAAASSAFSAATGISVLPPAPSSSSPEGEVGETEEDGRGLGHDCCVGRRRWREARDAATTAPEGTRRKADAARSIFLPTDWSGGWDEPPNCKMSPLMMHRSQ